MDWSAVDSVRALSANDGFTFKIRSRIARKVSGEDVISEKWPFDRLHLNRRSKKLQDAQADITVTHLWKKRGWTACRRPRPNLSILKKLTRSIVSFIFRILWNIRIWWSDKNKNWHRWDGVHFRCAKLLLGHPWTDLDETLGMYRVDLEIMQRGIFNFRFRPWTGSGAFPHYVIYVLWEKYFGGGHRNESRYISLTNAESDLYKPSKFHSNWFTRSGESLA